MKKYFLIIFVILPISLNSINYFSDFKPGEYVYYIDIRGKEPYYQGYMFLDINNGKYIIIIRSVNLNTKDEVRYQLNYERNYKTNLTTPEIKIISGFEKKENSQTIADFNNFLIFYNKNKINDNEEIDDYWPEFNYTLKHTYNKYLPLVKLVSLRKADETDAKYFIDRGGNFTGNDINDFLIFFPVNNDKTKTDQPFNIIEKKEKQLVEINDFQIELDKNWKKNNSLEFPSYWLSIITGRDSQIGVEKGNWNQIKSKGINNLFGFAKTCLLLQKEYVSFGSLKVTEKENYISLKYILLDNNNVKNIARSDFYLIDNDIYIINFSSFYSMYQQNEKYYEDIFNSIKFIDK